jgi:hypothetical protein
VSVGQKTLTQEVLTFEEYAKVAAVQEIQNHNSLASIEPITLENGMVGYKTTWMVQSIVNHEAPESESTPITYFQVPGQETLLLRVYSGYDVDPATYDRMIKSVTFNGGISEAAKSDTPVSLPAPSPAATLAPAVVATPTLTVDQEAALESTIKAQILADSESAGSTLTVSVSKITGNYAQGLASDDGGGGMWFAAKVNGAWELVWDGNGIILCSDLTDYPDFPASIIPECYDPVNDKSVKR